MFRCISIYAVIYVYVFSAYLNVLHFFNKLHVSYHNIVPSLVHLSEYTLHFTNNRLTYAHVVLNQYYNKTSSGFHRERTFPIKNTIRHSNILSYLYHRSSLKRELCEAELYK